MSIYSAELNYLNEITADEIIVVFNGTTYTVPKRTRTLPNSDVHTYYGTLGLVNDGDATGEYPFCIYVAQGLNTVYVSTDVYENHNPFTIKIMEESVTTTPCFDKARGYSCDEEMVTLTEETVTTTAHGGDLSYSQFINAETIRVTFGGTEYECPRIALNSSQNFYGGFDSATMTFDFSQYPFVISSHDNSSDVGGKGNTRDVTPTPNQLVTQTAGTYTIKITALGVTVTTTQCFEDAVNNVIDKIDCATVPIQACTPTLINLTPPSPAFTIHANTDDHIRFSTENNLSMYAVIRSINIPSGLVIRGYVFSTSYITLSVRNVTDSDISVSGANLSMQVVDFTFSDKVCVMLGTNCGEPGPK